MNGRQLCITAATFLLISLAFNFCNGEPKQPPRSLNETTTTTTEKPPPLDPVKPPPHRTKPPNHSFTIDETENCFRKDGARFQVLSGSIHYYRVPQGEWADRLLKAKLGGLNTIQTYIEWASHEPQEGVFDFSGMLNFTAFALEAQRQGLNLIFRLGPFIASERDGMGLPYWLPAKHPKMQVRTADAWFRLYVQRWYQELLPRLIPLLYINGGPVLMGQVENEYGSYGRCDEVYMTWLRDTFRSYFSPDFLLFTVDGGTEGLLECGHLDTVYPTVDFSPGPYVNGSFAAQRAYAPRGPLVNTEYYPGWFDTWGTVHQTVSANLTATWLAAMLAMNASVNIYMYHGGTSFGFMNGAYDQSGNRGSVPMVTSYDYDAPISDIGELTEKYWAIRRTIQKYAPNASPFLALNESQVLEEIRRQSGKTKAEELEKDPHQPQLNITLTATYLSSLFELARRLPVTTAQYPLSFEQLSVRHGYVLYETTVTFIPSDPIQLKVANLHDRAYVFVNEQYRGTLSRMDAIYTMPLSDLRLNDSLRLFVENQGHGCCSGAPEQKGILGNVTLEMVVLSGWRHYKVFANWSEAIGRDSLLGTPLASLHLPNQSQAQAKAQAQEKGNKGGLNTEDCACQLRDALRVPTFYVAQFKLDAETVYARHKVLVLNVGNCGFKGQAFLNGFNLGRYWPVMGPQVTLYIPRQTLMPSSSEKSPNTLVLFELERDARPCLKVFLSDRHIVNGTTPSNYRLHKEELETAEKVHPKARSSGWPDGLRPHH